MKVTYRAGQIVPHFLVKTKPNKMQHLWRFGCDVNVVGRKITRLTDGCIIVNSRNWIGGRKGKPRQYFKSVLIHDIVADPFTAKDYS